MNTGKVLRECRESLKWSRPYLSEKSDVSVSTIVVVEGKTDCKVSTLSKLIDPMGFEIKIQRKKYGISTE